MSGDEAGSCIGNPVSPRATSNRHRTSRTGYGFDGHRRFASSWKRRDASERRVLESQTDAPITMVDLEIFTGHAPVFCFSGHITPLTAGNGPEICMSIVLGSAKSQCFFMWIAVLTTWWRCVSLTRHGRVLVFRVQSFLRLVFMV